jgi:hypothetical protein
MPWTSESRSWLNATPSAIATIGLSAAISVEATGESLSTPRNQHA